MPRADMRVEGARHPRGAGDVPEDISPGSAETRLTPNTVIERGTPQGAIAAERYKQQLT